MAKGAAVEGAALRGRSVIVTGGATGIGLATARAFARSGAKVLIASRDDRACAAAIAAINGGYGENSATQASLDLACFRSIRQFAAEVANRPIDILVNNAGVIMPELRRTAEGFEWHFGVNFMGAFLLSNLLVENLAATKESRMIQLTSGAHHFGAFSFADPNFDREPYATDVAYGRSKTACALLAVGFQARYGKRGIEAFSVSPGIVRTPLLDVLGEGGRALVSAFPEMVRTVDQAAETILFAATAPELSGKGGLYIEDCAPANPAVQGMPGGVMPFAIDPEIAERLWGIADDFVRAPPTVRAVQPSHEG